MADTTAWEVALQDARKVLSGIGESELIGADAAGKATFRLVEILMEHMAGRHVPFEDRKEILDKWRPVMVALKEDKATVQLLLASGHYADEPPDTAGGKLPYVTGTNSLKSEYGMRYRLPVQLIDVLDLVVSDDSDDSDDDTGDGGDGDGRGGGDDDGAGVGIVIGGGGGSGRKDDVIEIVDKMRVMWKEKPMTVRTRDGTGDTAIAGTKVRLLSMQPGDFEMPLRSDLVAGIQSGAVQVLSADNDPEDVLDHPADVLRSDKHVTGTLYGEVAWPFAGAGAAPPRRHFAHAVLVLVLVIVIDTDTRHGVWQARENTRPRCTAGCSNRRCPRC